MRMKHFTQCFALRSLCLLLYTVISHAHVSDQGKTYKKEILPFLSSSIAPSRIGVIALRTQFEPVYITLGGQRVNSVYSVLKMSSSEECRLVRFCCYT